MKYDNPELRRRLAAEYALGTLRGAARRRFERLLVRDADLHALVALWEERLARMAWDAAPVARVPPANWRAIEARIGAPATTSRGLWQSVAFWRGLGLAATTVAVALLILPVGIRTPGPEPMPERIAMIAESGGESTGWLITAAAGGRHLSARALAPPEMPEGEVCVLWLVWPDGTVRVVGVLPEYGEAVLPAPGMDRPPYQARVTVTIERASDLPWSAPTGPQVFQGPWVEL
jgi:anti-sigma-K factor RskA